METQKLYQQDPFLKTFTSTVVSCEAVEGGFAVVLEATAFYPEGGGQPADQGVLDTVPVTDVQQRDGLIVHTCPQALPVGHRVTGSIDWARRFDHMQQHSGEHILSGILCSLYHCDNVGFHMGADTVTIDYNADISWEQALTAEEKANAIIAADTPVEITYPPSETLAALDYRSKKEIDGQVRIVTFPGADCCACCGTHVNRAGQVALVKVLSVQKFRHGVRMEIVCGLRALRLLSTLYDQNRAVAQQLSVKMTDTAEAVQRALQELSDAKLRMSELEDQVFTSVAEQNEGSGNILLLEPPMRPDGVRRLADALAQRRTGLCAVFAGADTSYHYALIHTDGKDISPLVKELNAALHGRGGGRNGFAQGNAQASQAEIKTFFTTQGRSFSLGQG